MKHVTRWLSPGFLLIALASCGASVDEQIAQARQYQSEKHYEAAIIELKNALQQDRQSAEARWLLGQTYMKSGDFSSAEKELQHAQRLAWNPNDIMPALARVLLYQGEFEELDRLAPVGLEATAKASLFASQALSRLARGEDAQAEKLVSKALSMDADSVEAHLARAKILANAGDLNTAIGAVDDILVENPGNGSAWSLLGDLRVAGNQPAEARIAFDTAIELRPKNFSDRYKAAMAALVMQDLEAAQAHASILLVREPRHIGSNFVQGVILYQQADYARAIPYLALAEEIVPQYPTVLFYLASAHMVEGHANQAASYAEHFYTVQPDNLEGRKLLAYISLQEGEGEEVQALLGPVLQARPNDIEAMNIMANALLGLGKTDQAIDLLAEVAQLQPGSASAQMRLGAGLMTQGGDKNDATGHIAAALELDPQFQQADILLVLNHLQNKEYESAVEAAKSYQRRNPVNVIPRNLLGRVYLRSGDLSAARKSFESTLKIDRGEPTANYHLAQMAVAEGDTARARDYYQSILSHYPGNELALLRLAEMDAADNNEEGMVKYLEHAIKAHPESLRPRLILGHYYLAKGRAENVVPLFAGLSEEQKQVPEVLELRAKAQIATRENEQAKRTLDSMADSGRETASGHHLRAIAALGENDKTMARQSLEKALALDPGHTPSLVLMSRLAVEDKSLEVLQPFLARLETLAPNAPDVLQLRAARASLSGDPVAAAKLAEQAFGTSPNTNSLLALVAYQRASGREKAATELTMDWLQQHSADTGARLALADQLLSSGDAAAATTQFRKILESDPDSVTALNNVAWQIRTEQPTEALALIRRASQLAPDSAEVMDTQAVIEYLQRDYRRAARSIRGALHRQPANPSMQYHSAMIDAALGESDRAIGVLETLLSGDQQFPEREEAEKLLNKLSG